MIVVKVKGEEYTIDENFNVSKGKYQQYIKECIELISFEHRTWMGYLEPNIFVKLHDFTGIEPISIDFTPPDDEGMIY